MTSPPSADAQLLFLSRLQRLFAEGDFTATYKFALLISLADLAVEHGRDDGSSLRLSTRRLAEKFIELYWQQTAPYSAGGRANSMHVLVQNHGSQAAVITAITDFQLETGIPKLQAASSSPHYRSLVTTVAGTVAAQPIEYLQNLGSSTEPFLYDRERGGIVLKPGVGYCLRRFQPLVQQLARSHWVGHVKRNRLNLPMLGQSDDLESFLFETSRETLEVIGAGLRRFTGGRCFYCGATVHEADVDHFIPFSLYPRDLVHNFVLAHPACNRSKSDTLAARPHLESWLEYITSRDDALREIGEAAGRISEPTSSLAVARWGYANAMTSGAQAWHRAKIYERVDKHYLDCLT